MYLRTVSIKECWYRNNTVFRLVCKHLVTSYLFFNEQRFMIAVWVECKLFAVPWGPPHLRIVDTFIVIFLYGMETNTICYSLQSVLLCLLWCSPLTRVLIFFVLRAWNCTNQGFRSVDSPMLGFTDEHQHVTKTTSICLDWRFVWNDWVTFFIKVWKAKYVASPEMDNELTYAFGNTTSTHFLLFIKIYAE